MSRAWSSVGTCALSKLLSRHKLLVSDQVSSLPLMLMVDYFRLVVPLLKIFGCFVWLFWFTLLISHRMKFRLEMLHRWVFFRGCFVFSLICFF